MAAAFKVGDCVFDERVGAKARVTEVYKAGPRGTVRLAYERSSISAPVPTWRLEHTTGCKRVSARRRTAKRKKRKR